MGCMKFCHICRCLHSFCHYCIGYHVLFTSIGLYFLILFSFSSFSTTLYKLTVSPIHLDYSRGKESHSETQSREDGGTQCQRPTQCSAHSCNRLSVHICWLFKNGGPWISDDWQKLNKCKVWQCVWPKLEFVCCGNIWGQNRNPILLPQLKPPKIVPHCGFWDSKKRRLQEVYCTSFRRLMGSQWFPSSWILMG